MESPALFSASTRSTLLLIAALWNSPAWGIGHSLKTTIHLEVGAPNLGGSWSSTTTTDQDIEWAGNPSGTQSVVNAYYPWYVQAYDITSRTANTTYNSNGSSSVTYSSTGAKALPPSTFAPAPSPLIVPWRKWNRTSPDSSFTNQTTTVQLRPIATGTEDGSTYGLFVVNVSATSATGTAIPSGSITVAGETADAQGNVYLSYPLDGALRTITPSISGYTDYEFLLSVQPAKLVISFGNPTPTEPIPVWVSDRIDLSMSLQPAVAGIDPGTHTWQVPGSKISRFNHDTLPCGPIWWTDPHTSSTTFTWVLGGNLDVIVQARVKGKFLASKLKFSVTRPEINPSSVFPCPGPVIGYPLNNPSRLAVGLLGGCSAPAPPSPVNSGFFASTALGQPTLWVQVISSATATVAEYNVWTINRSSTGLDEHFPYSSNPFMQDSPYQYLTYSAYPAANFVSRSDSYGAYLMIARSGADFAVPIGLVNWTWNTTAKRDSGIWSLTSGYKNIPISQHSSDFPTWSRIGGGAELIP